MQLRNGWKHLECNEKAGNHLWEDNPPEMVFVLIVGGLVSRPHCSGYAPTNVKPHLPQCGSKVGITRAFYAMSVY